MGVGGGGIGGDGQLVGRDGLRDASQVLERDPQVESRDGIVRARRQREEVVVGRRQRMAVLVKQASEVHPRSRVGRIQLQRALVGVLRLARRVHLQLAGEVIPVLGLALGRQVGGRGRPPRERQRPIRQRVGFLLDTTSCPFYT